VAPSSATFARLVTKSLFATAYNAAPAAGRSSQRFVPMPSALCFPAAASAMFESRSAKSITRSENSWTSAICSNLPYSRFLDEAFPSRLSRKRGEPVPDGERFLGLADHASAVRESVRARLKEVDRETNRQLKQRAPRALLTAALDRRRRGHSRPEASPFHPWDVAWRIRDAVVPGAAGRASARSSPGRGWHKWRARGGLVRDVHVAVH
jgi:hypothetical protein